MRHCYTSIIGIAVGVTVVSGCVSRDAGFGNVSGLVHERIGQDVRWHAPDGAVDARVGTRVDAILAEPLAADDAVTIALLANPALQAAFEELGIARGRLLQASLPPNPEVEAEAGFTGGEDRPDLGLSATLGISDLFFVPMRRGVARAELEATRLRAASAALDLAHDTRMAFYDYQAAEQILALARTGLEAVAASHDIAQRLHEAGNITDLALASERALHEEARLAVADAELAAMERRERLAVLMGLGGERVDWRLAGHLPAPPASADQSVEQSAEQLTEQQDSEAARAALEQRAVARNLALRALEQRRAAAARRARLARTEGLLPELHAGVSAEREEGPWEVGPVVGLALPLFDHGQGRVAAARAELRQITRAHAAQALRVRAAVRVAQRQLIAAARRAGHYREVLLPLAAQVVDETQRQYNAMQVGVFQLIEARRRQIETGRAYVLALRDYWQARAALDQLLAGGLAQAAPADRSAMPMQDAGPGAGSQRGGH